MQRETVKPKNQNLAVFFLSFFRSDPKMMKRLISVAAARHGSRNYMINSSFYSQGTTVRPPNSTIKVFFSIPSFLQLHRHSSSVCFDSSSLARISYREDEVVVMASKDFENLMTIVSSSSSTLDLNINPVQKIIETTSTPPPNLILFIKWVWNTNKNLITTSVLESLVSAILATSTPRYSPRDVELKKIDMLLLWDFLNHIGHYQTGLVNTSILNQLLGFFRFMDDGEAALQVFSKFEEVFHCVPNQDTYTNIMLTLINISSDYDEDINSSPATPATADVKLQQLAFSICKKMLLHPETLLPDDGFIFGKMLTFFAEQNMIEETHALYLAAKEKRKTDPNWPPEAHIEMLLPTRMIHSLCNKEETVHLALEMLTGIDNPNEMKGWELEASRIVIGLCRFKDFDAAKQLIFKMCGDGQLPRPSYKHIRPFIRHSVRIGEIRQALEMVVLSERLGLNTCDLFDTVGEPTSDLPGVVEAKKILEEAKKNKDLKSITVLLYHTLIFLYCKLHKFNKARELLTQMKDFGVSHTNHDEYQKLIHSFCLKDVDRRMAIKELSKIYTVNSRMQEEQFKEMDLKIRASF